MLWIVSRLWHYAACICNKPKDFVYHHFNEKEMGFWFCLAFLDRIYVCVCVSACVTVYMNSFDNTKLLLVNLSSSNCLSSVRIRYRANSVVEATVSRALHNAMNWNSGTIIIITTTIAATATIIGNRQSSCLLWLKLLIKSVFGLSSNCTNFLYLIVLTVSCVFFCHANHRASKENF